MSAPAVADRRYDLKPFQERALELVDKGFSWSELAHFAGYRREGSPSQRGEASRLKRQLGLMSEGGRTTIKTHVSYPMAVRLCDALGIDYVDVGV